MTAVDRSESEPVLLRCERCGATKEVPLSQTEGAQILGCSGCGGSIYWHQCPHCGLRYSGAADTPCAVCDDVDLDDLQIL